MSRVRRSHPEARTSSCTKFSLFFINIFFWIVGATVVAFGSYVLVESKEFYQQLADLSFQPAVLFFVVGFVIFIITFIGCIGALRENTCLLCAYVGILTIILLMLMVFATIGFVFKEKVESEVTTTFKTAIAHYRDPKRQDLTNLIDATQQEFQCCGAQSYNDWETNIYFNCSASFNGIKASSSCGVPFSCCFAKLQLNTQCGYGMRKPDQKTAVERTKTIHSLGCIVKVKSWFTSNLVLIGSICIGVFVLQLISIFLASNLREEIKDIRGK